MERENYDEFQKAMNRLIEISNNSFNNMSINDFSDLITANRECIEKWEYLNKDIEHLFNEEE